MKEDRIGYRVKTLSQMHRKAVEKFLDGPKDRTTRMQSWIIGYINDMGRQQKDVFQKDIEKHFNINRSTNSEILSNMEGKGMIKKESVAYDGRLKKIVLTPQSLKFIDHLDDAIMQVSQGMIESLDSQAVEAFCEMADLMVLNLQKIIDEGVKTDD